MKTQDTIRNWFIRTFCKGRLLRDATRLLKATEAELDAAEQEIDRLQDRFRRLGSQIETLNPEGGIHGELVQIDVEPIPFGQYIRCEFGDNADWKDTIIKDCQSRIAEKLANAMIDNNLVQIIVHTPFEDGPISQPLSNTATIGIKLFVVPWEQLAQRKIQLMVQR